LKIINYIINIIKYSLPFGIHLLYNKYKEIYFFKPTKEEKKILKINAKFKDIHKGERCFIVCSGPSINKQNLLPLKNEKTFFVSSGFLHPNYNEIKPLYFCLPPSNDLLNQDRYNRFRKMEETSNKTNFFFSISDKKYLYDNDLFLKDKVNYIYFDMQMDNKRKEIYDLTKQIPSVQSVPIMCLMIAMYMGFKEIFLLGTEHDSFKGEYRHFYENTEMTEDCVVNNKISSLYLELKSCVSLWEQYMHLKRIAENNNIKIFNATEGGALDVFPRVKFESLFI